MVAFQAICWQNQYDALCSFIFNIGGTAFKGSTMLKLLNQANYQGAADDFPKWKKSGNDPDILMIPGCLITTSY